MAAVAAGLLVAIVFAATASAQTAADAAGGAVVAASTASGLPADFEGPPAPLFPETISRDDAGHAVVRAIRLTAPFRLDGRLDEAPYREMRPASDFIQEEPNNGAPATEKTEIWILYDNDNIYVGARMWESQPDRMVVNEMRKDSPSVFQNENLTVAFDTFYDHRNGVAFVINPIGGRQDGQITNERWNRDWNTIFDFAVARFEGGWTAELAIPFKSLRYRPGTAQLWGVNARRVNKWKNEYSNLVPTPTTGGFGSGVYRTSLAATLVGLEVPPGSKNLEIKPYAISDLTTDRRATPRISNDVGANAGIDVKYGITQNLIADFTYNTDFAQVEADEQQVNLTRFSLFFPEKREFFLENPGLFAFGGVNTVNSGQTTSDAPMLFYSRRIGLNQGRVVPLDAGGRITGRVGRYTVGLMNIQTGEESESRSRPTNFSVVRLKRDVLRRSSIGLIATGRSVTVDGAGSNTVYGFDGAFSFFDHVDFNTYWARTRTSGLSGEDTSYRTAFVYSGDRYGLELERLAVGDNFNPEVGFVRRDDMRRTSGSLRFSPRPRSSLVRKYSWEASIDYTENGAGRLETRDTQGQFGIEFQNSDRFTLNYLSSYELLPRPFRIASGIVLPVGGYNSGRTRASFNLGNQRTIAGSMFAEYGAFYSGHRTTLGFTGARVKVTPQFAVEPAYSINKVTLLEGAFTTHLAGSRVTYSMTPLMFASALLQYNSTNHVVSANARLRWEYAPGSELFVVFNEERDTVSPRFPELANRSFIVKINRLLRF